MSLVDRRKNPAGFLQRVVLRLTGRLRRAGDHGDSPAVDLRLELADIALSRIGHAAPQSPYSRAALPAGDPRFIARDAARGAVEHGFSMWQEGRPTLIALTGPAGCGLTSILNQVPTWLSEQMHVARLDLDRRPDATADALALATSVFGAQVPYDSIDTAAAQINALPPQVVLVDNGHFLYPRLMGGSEGVRALHGLMVATQGRHLWIVACETQAWRRQCDTARTHRYFDDVAELDYFSRDELAALIAARTPAGHAGPDAQAIDALHRISRGHPALALFVAERTLRDDTPAIPAPFDEAPLRELERTELLTLAEIAAHGTLTARELRSIFRRDDAGTSILLHHLRQSGLIVSGPHAGTEPGNRLEPLVAPMIIAHLVRANYLY